MDTAYVILYFINLNNTEANTKINQGIQEMIQDDPILQSANE